MVEAATRLYPLTGREFAGNGVNMRPLDGEHERISLRADDAAVAGLGAAIGLELPTKPGGVALADGLSALWLGPDEWLIMAEKGAGIEDKLNSVTTGLYSVVSINHRNTAILVYGANAVNALNGGCPRDLSLEAFPAGTCSRTIIGKAEVVLWRTDTQSFHVECWRSFSDYVWKFLVEAARCA